MKTQHFYISLMDVITLLKQRYRDYVLSVAQQHQGMQPLPFPNQSWDLNHIPFMDALLREIFEEPFMGSDMNGKNPQSLNILIDTGVDKKTAQFIAAEAFKGTVDAISTHVPEIVFGTDSDYRGGLCNTFDLIVSKLPTYA